MDELMQKYNLTAEEINFETDGLTEEELEAKFAELNASKNTAGEQNNAEEKFAANEPSAEQPKEEQVNFSLTLSQYADELRKVLHQVMFVNPRYPDWGECRRYYYVDCDIEKREVYAYDELDNRLYGFMFSMNGDNFEIDYASAKRKKIVYADFVENEEQDTALFSAVGEAREFAFAKLDETIAGLNEYVDQKKAEEHEAAVSVVFAQFSDLAGVELFEQLRNDASAMSIEDVTEKCYAIRGRQAPVMKFSETKEPTGTRIPVEKIELKDNEPYGGLFREFGVVN